MADGIQVLDLDSPGKLWVNSENEETNTIHIVVPQEKYTKEAMAQNPTVDPGDQLISPWSASYKDADANGVVTLDLAASGKAKEIKNKLDQLFQGGRDPPKTVKVIVIAAAKDGNRIPPKQVGAVMDLELMHTPEMRFLGKARPNVDPIYVTAAQFNAGTKDFLLEITTKNITGISITTSSGQANLWAEGGAKSKTLTLSPKDDQPITIHADVLMTMGVETRQIYMPQITYAWDRWQPAWWKTEQRNVFQGQEYTIDAVGTGGGEPVKKSIKVRAEAWGAMSDWMNPNPGYAGPPQVYYHPHT